MLIGAVNDFNGNTNSVLNQLTGSYGTVPDTARAYKNQGSDPSWWEMRTTEKVHPGNMQPWNRAIWVLGQY